MVILDQLYYVDRARRGLRPRRRRRAARPAVRDRHRGGGRERRAAVSAPCDPPGREGARTDDAVRDFHSASRRCISIGSGGSRSFRSSRRSRSISAGGVFPRSWPGCTQVLSGFTGREAQLRGVDLTLGSQAVVRLRQGGGSDARARSTCAHERSAEWGWAWHGDGEADADRGGPRSRDVEDLRSSSASVGEHGIDVCRARYGPVARPPQGRDRPPRVDRRRDPQGGRGGGGDGRLRDPPRDRQHRRARTSAALRATAWSRSGTARSRRATWSACSTPRGAVALPADREVLHVLPQEFIIDDQEGISEPLGIARRAARGQGPHRDRPRPRRRRTSSSAASRPGSRSATSCSGRSPRPMRSSRPRRRTSASRSSTSAAARPTSCIFHGGAVRHTAVPAARGRRTSPTTSRPASAPRPSRPRRSSSASAAHGPTRCRRHMSIEVPSVGDREPRVLSRHILCEIIEPRVEEIFTLVSREIIRSGLRGSLASGVVLTGGTALLDSVAEVAEQVLASAGADRRPAARDGARRSRREPRSTAASIGLVVASADSGGRRVVHR